MTPRSALATAALMACGALSRARAQNILPLDFSQNVQAVNAIYPNNSTLGPEYYNGLTFDFRNVTNQGGQAVDARVSVIGTQGNYNFVGWIPDYNSDAGQPEGDLGVYYRHDGIFPPVDPLNPGAERFSTGGMAFTISFFIGDGSFTTSTVLSEVGFLIYDFDGEPGQSELIRTYLSDGFSGYQIRNGSGIDSHFQGDSQLFEAPGTNLSETGPQGSFIAYYQNTSQIRFDLFSTTGSSNPPGNNGIFASFDGDLGLVGGDLSGYGGFVPVPEPGVPLLAGTAIAALLLRRNRAQS
jgi:hypothetical protein